MAKAKAPLIAALAKKQAPAIALTGNIKISLVIERVDLAKLKASALKHRVIVNDLILEFIAKGLALNGLERHATMARMAANPNLSPEARAIARKARVKAALALERDTATERRKVRQAKIETSAMAPGK
jgi:hypothetical protein